MVEAEAADTEGVEVGAEVDMEGATEGATEAAETVGRHLPPALCIESHLSVNTASAHHHMYRGLGVESVVSCCTS